MMWSTHNLVLHFDGSRERHPVSDAVDEDHSVVTPHLRACHTDAQTLDAAVRVERGAQATHHRLAVVPLLKVIG